MLRIKDFKKVGEVTMRRKRTKKAGIFLTLVLALGVTGGTAVCAADVGVTDLADKGTEAPEAWGAVPSPNQYRYQKDELAAFCHFGPNTFSGVEWGEHYGNTHPRDLFTLSEDFDAETMVRSMKEAGFKKLIITAKHHDGFCLWASDYTDYDVANTNYKNGQGDILAEISAACTKYDMDMGLYLSPWDIHEPSYGYYDANGNATTKENDVLDYNDYYNNQLQEILGNEKYGNNGHFVEVWMDGAKGSGANAQDYDFQRWFATIQANEGLEAGYDDDCMLFGAEAYTTVRWIGNELGLANEETWSKSKTDKKQNTIDSNRTGSNGTTVGFADGNQWTVPEADSRITSGWFWGNNKKTPKSVAELANMYFNSVGHNATLLLNIPPNNQGKVDQEILDRMLEFGQNVKDSFADNLAKNAAVTASEVRGNDIAFAPENVIDGDDDTYWTMEDGSTTGSLTLNLGGTKTFDMVTVEEAIQLGQRISSFCVEYRVGNGEWKNFAEGTTIGAKRICRNSAVKASEVRISITGSYAVPLISEVGVYKATEGFEIGSTIPDGLEVINVTDKDTSDGAGFAYSGWTAESGPQFIDGNAMWANAGKEATLTFHGSKVWLYGTKDSGHGTADIYIDGEKADSINTQSSPRETGVLIYESPDLADGPHTLRIVNTGTIGLNAAAVLNNGGKGMIEFDIRTLDMEEDTEAEVVVRRVGGSTGEVKAIYENNPGSAVQGDYDVDGIGGEIVFANGETEKTVKIRTMRDDRVKGDIGFTVDLISAEAGAVLGFQTTIKVTIHDLDDPVRIEEAKATLEETQALLTNTSEELPEVRKLAKELSAYLAAREKTEVISVGDIVKLAKKLEEAVGGVELKFELPVGSEVKTVEAEAFLLDASQAVDQANKYVRYQENSNASGGKEVNWFEQGNRIYLPFTAPKAGIYKVTATYRSGRGESNPNALVWSGTNVAAGSKDVYGEEGAGAFHTAELNIEVTQAGDGELSFTADSKGGPVLDKFVIECVDKTPVAPIAVTGVTLEEENLTILRDKPYALVLATVAPVNAGNQEVTYTSSNPEVATVDENGMVFGIKSGRTTITVTTADGAKTAQCQVTVKMFEVESVSLNMAEAILTKKDQSVKLVAKVLPEEAINKEVAYTSSNPAVATVDKDGLVKAVANGETIITVTTADGAKTAQCRVTVKIQEEIKPDPDKLPKGVIKEGLEETVGSGRYQVINAKNKTAKLVSVMNRKAMKLNVPATVKINGVICKVVEVCAKVMKGNTRLKKVILGKNIAKIGKQAFSGCKNLKMVQMKGKALKTVQSGAWKNTHAKMVVSAKKMAKKQKAALFKKLKRAGMSKKGKVK